MTNVNIDPTTVYWDIVAAYNTGAYDIIALQGGTRSSKTYSILQALITIISYCKRPILASVVSESLPHLKRGALRDFQKMMGIGVGSHGWHSTDRIYTFPNGCRMEFFSADRSDKLRGAARDILFLNECNNITHEAAQQLMVRTREITFMDWNPQAKFWFHEKYQDSAATWFHVSTHWDNHHLEEKIRKSIEAMKYKDFEWYRVYGMGQIGQWKGKVFKNHRKEELSDVWKSVDQSLVRCGLDFGYNPDPCAFVMAARIGAAIYVFKEFVLCETTNEDLAEVIRPWSGDSIVWCDSASPDRIRSLRKNGVNARSVGKKNREYSTSWLAAHEIIIDNDCKSTQKEIEDYARKTDKNGEILPIFQDKFDHCIDALRYAFTPDIIGKGQINSLHLAI